MSLVIDEDYRLEHGLAAGARSVTVRGDAELSQEPGLIEDIDLQIPSSSTWARTTRSSTSSRSWPRAARS